MNGGAGHFSAFLNSGPFLRPQRDVGNSPHSIAQQGRPVQEHALVIIPPSHDGSRVRNRFGAWFMVFEDGGQIFVPFQQLIVQLRHLGMFR